MAQIFIGMLARQTGVPVKTIRYYEDVGVLLRPPRTESGYRLYAPEVVDRLQFIKKAQSLGLRLDDIKEILELADRGRCPCGHVQHLLNLRLQELKRKIAGLHLIERRITQARRSGCPPRFRPHGRAVCPTIERQRVQQRGGG